MKRHFAFDVAVPPGRREIGFVFTVKGGETLTQRAVWDFPPGTVVRAQVDVGTLGRDIDVTFR